MVNPEYVPNAAALLKAFNHNIYDESENITTFGSLFSAQDSCVTKVLAIFIRHFFCGNCQEYVRQIYAAIPLKSLPSHLKVVFIGCGSPSLIESYQHLVTSCDIADRYAIYAEPSTDLYRILGMYRSLSLGTRSPDYIKHSLAAGMVKSIVQGLKRISQGDVMSAGDLSVNGGEFLFERTGNGETGSSRGINLDWKVSWCHRMVNTRDHCEIKDLKRILALDERLSDTSTPGTPTTDHQELQAEKVRMSQSATLRKSLSLRRQSWKLARSTNVRANAVQVS